MLISLPNPTPPSKLGTKDPENDSFSDQSVYFFCWGFSIPALRNQTDIFYDIYKRPFSCPERVFLLMLNIGTQLKTNCLHYVSAHSVINSTITVPESSTVYQKWGLAQLQEILLDLSLTRAPERRKIRLLPVLTTSSSGGGPQRAEPRSSVTRAVGDILPVIRSRSWPTCVTSRWRPRFFCHHDGVALYYNTVPSHLFRGEWSRGSSTLVHPWVNELSTAPGRKKMSFCAS